eukprot:scaffold950_cov360-Pavlova_lutheri.AAC.7
MVSSTRSWTVDPACAAGRPSIPASRHIFLTYPSCDLSCLSTSSTPSQSCTHCVSATWSTRSGALSTGPWSTSTSLDGSWVSGTSCTVGTRAGECGRNARSTICFTISSSIAMPTPSATSSVGVAILVSSWIHPEHRSFRKGVSIPIEPGRPRRETSQRFEVQSNPVFFGSIRGIETGPSEGRERSRWPKPFDVSIDLAHHLVSARF